MTPDTGAALIAVALVGVAAVAVFESIKADFIAGKAACICGHPLRAIGDKGHCQKGDADSTWFHPGGKYKPGQCRACRCRTFIPR